jgi:Flp pilus assembly protein TadB
MPIDLTPWAAAVLLATVLSWPAVLASIRRSASREASEVANSLEAFSRESRGALRCPDIDPELASRIARLRMPELGAFQLAPNLPHATPELVAGAAARLALRLRRRVAFERKMLARTASGRRRGAVIGAVPPAVLIALAAGGIEVPVVVLVIVAFAEGIGCWLLTRIATVAP